jgi:hypothetical protein
MTNAEMSKISAFGIRHPLLSDGFAMRLDEIALDVVMAAAARGPEHA